MRTSVNDLFSNLSQKVDDNAKILEENRKLLKKHSAMFAAIVPFVNFAQFRGARTLAHRGIYSRLNMKSKDPRFQQLFKFAKQNNLKKKPPQVVLDIITEFSFMSVFDIITLFQNGYDDEYNNLLHSEGRFQEIMTFLEGYVKEGTSREAQVLHRLLYEMNLRGYLKNVRMAANRSKHPFSLGDRDYHEVGMFVGERDELDGNQARLKKRMANLLEERRCFSIVSGEKSFLSFRLDNAYIMEAYPDFMDQLNTCWCEYAAQASPDIRISKDINGLYLDIVRIPEGYCIQDIRRIVKHAGELMTEFVIPKKIAICLYPWFEIYINSSFKKDVDRTTVGAINIECLSIRQAIFLVKYFDPRGSYNEHAFNMYNLKTLDLPKGTLRDEFSVPDDYNICRYSAIQNHVKLHISNGPDLVKKNVKRHQCINKKYKPIWISSDILIALTDGETLTEMQEINLVNFCIIMIDEKTYSDGGDLTRIDAHLIYKDDTSTSDIKTLPWVAGEKAVLCNLFLLQEKNAEALSSLQTPESVTQGEQCQQDLGVVGRYCDATRVLVNQNVEEMPSGEIVKLIHLGYFIVHQHFRTGGMLSLYEVSCPTAERAAESMMIHDLEHKHGDDESKV